MSVSIALEQPTDADIDAIHAVLTESYWSPGIPRSVVAKACANSVCVIARNERRAVVGFGRAITDGATFAWVADVFVTPEHQGQGIARKLVKALHDAPGLQGLRRWMLRTKDAHGVYEPLGYKAEAAPELVMSIVRANPYGKSAA
jgi:predicted N-acetyltransferase YhbS